MSLINTIQTTLTPVHREGYRFIAAFAGITLLLFWFGADFFGYIGLVLTAWCAYFFRDPERVTPLRPGLVVAPADGRISLISDVIPPPELDLPREAMQRVSIFMNVFDVHINRAPVDGAVVMLAYVPGAFVNAELDKASEKNERQALTIEMKDGKRIGVVQIAGLVARRIVKFVNQHDTVITGQRFGLIRFGSRVDVYLPIGVAPLVCIGQRTIAGETVIADLSSTEPSRMWRKD